MTTCYTTVRALRRTVASSILVAGLFTGCAPDSNSGGNSATGPQYDVVSGGTRSVRTTAELEPIGRHVAAVLRHAAAREFFAASMGRSRIKERKLHLQPFLKEMSITIQASLPAGAQRHLSEAIDAAQEYRPLEIYLPIREQRASWTSSQPLQVAVIHGDDDTPVVFDATEVRKTLSIVNRPSAYTVVITPAEQSFLASANGLACDPLSDPECVPCDPEEDEGCAEEEGGGSGGTGGSGNTVNPDSTSLFMTWFNVYDVHEPWIKGDPEIEIHILGQAGSSDSLTTYQCIGAGGGYYAFDYNDASTDFHPTNPVLLFTRTQLNAYKTAHPGQNFRIFVLEDDDTECVVKVNGTDFFTMMTDVATAYPAVDAAIDSTINLAKTLKAASGLKKAIASVHDWLTGNDDMIGTAVEDAYLGGLTLNAGKYNWFIRGTGNADVGKMGVIFK